MFVVWIVSGRGHGEQENANLQGLGFDWNVQYDCSLWVVLTLLVNFTPLGKYII